MCIGDIRHGAKPYHLGGQIHLTKAESYDLALWRLPPELAEALTNCTFVHLSDVDFGVAPPVPGLFLIHGYPSCWSATDTDERTLSIRPFTYVAGLYDGPTDRLLLDKSAHLLLPFSARAEENTALGGSLPNMPDGLKGISGCSIWQIWRSGQTFESFRMADVKAVAVETCTYERRPVVRGTRWWVVHKILSQKYPELRRAMALHE